jgi:hypothetical protein
MAKAYGLLSMPVRSAICVSVPIQPIVQEFSSDWKTVLRLGSTDTHGRFSFAPAPHRTIYFIQISAPGFDPLRFRLQVDTTRGADLKLKLTVAT